MSNPGDHRLLDALERSWPPARSETVAGWLLRFDPGGGKRVSAASRLEPAAVPSLARSRMLTEGQRPLFKVAAGEDDLDCALDAEGYAIVDPSEVWAGAALPIGDRTEPCLHILHCEFPPAILRSFWSDHGIGPGRLAVMARAEGPQVYLMARAEDHVAGAAFAACIGDVVAIHALEIAAPRRRAGLGRRMVAAAARWGRAQGAGTLALAVTAGNAAAKALYVDLGMTLQSTYQYRAAPEGAE